MHYQNIQFFNIYIYLLFSLFLFFVGVLGIFVVKKNIIIILISIELILLATNLNFIVFSIELDDIIGQLFSIFILSVAGAEASIGLAILIIFYRLRGIISTSYIISLKG